MSASQSLAPTYTCKFCRRTFALNGPVLIGEKPEERVARLSQTLWKHLGETHREETAQILLAGNQFSGWLMFSQFQHTDAELSDAGEALRMQFRKTTKRVSISDEEIEQQVNQLPNTCTELAGPAMRAEIRVGTKTVISLLKAMRNTLEEITPQKP